MKNPTSNSNINAVKETRRLLNELRRNLSREETKRIRQKLYKKEAASYFFKEKEQERSLTNRQKNLMYLKNISKHLKNFKKHFKKSKKYQYDTDYLFDRYLKNFKKDLDKLQKYQYNITHGLDY